MTQLASLSTDACDKRQNTYPTFISPGKPLQHPVSQQCNLPAAVCLRHRMLPSINLFALNYLFSTVHRVQAKQASARGLRHQGRLRESDVGRLHHSTSVCAYRSYPGPKVQWDRGTGRRLNLKRSDHIWAAYLLTYVLAGGIWNYSNQFRSRTVNTQLTTSRRSWSLMI